jgi:hypothetical protein
MNECDFVIDVPDDGTRTAWPSEPTGWETVVFELEDDD